MRHFIICLLLLSIIGGGFAAAEDNTATDEMTLGEFIFRWLHITVPDEKIEKSNNNEIGSLVEQVVKEDPQAKAPGNQIDDSDESVLDHVHIVSRGETLTSISERYGVTISNIKQYNRLENANRIYAGQSLLLGPQTTVHTIKQGDTLWGLAQKYNTTVVKIKQSNPELSPERLVIGTTIIIPVESNNNTTPRFSWPLKGVLTSGYGIRNGSFHHGIDIAAATKTVIKAAESGKVELAGWSGSYGNCLLIEHGQQWETRYAHASKLLVKKGDYVTKGQPVALVGSTGNSTGPHLHFEIIFNSETKNPIKYLN